MENIYKLIEMEHFQEAIEIIQENLKNKEKSSDFIEELINSLKILEEKSEVIIHSIFPNLCKFIDMENDVLRYSLLLCLKSLCESHPDLVIPFSKEYLNSENGNAREGMLQLLTYAAAANPEILKPLIDEGVFMLADQEDYVQKKAIEFLETLGKKYSLEIEQKLLDGVQSTTVEVFRENAEIVLKSLIDIRKLEMEELEKKNLKVKVKVLENKEKLITEEEVKIKEEEIRKREEIVTIKKEGEEIEEVLKNKEKELIEKERALKEKELNLKEAALLVEEKEKEIEEEKIRHKAEQLQKDIEINRKRHELDNVKKELEMKEIKKETEQIIKEEQKRVEKRLNLIEEEDDNDYDELNLDD